MNKTKPCFNDFRILLFEFSKLPISKRIEKYFSKQKSKDIYRIRKRVKSQLTTPINKKVRADFRRIPKNREILDG